MKRNRIIPLQHLGEIVKTANENTRACGGVCALVDGGRCGLGSKVQFMCEICLKTYHFLLIPKMVGLKGYKRYEVNYGGVLCKVENRKNQ